MVVPMTTTPLSPAELEKRRVREAYEHILKEQLRRPRLWPSHVPCRWEDISDWRGGVGVDAA